MMAFYHVVQALGTETVPHILIVGGIPPHDTGIDAHMIGTPQILEISYSPKMRRWLLPYPIYVANYHCVKIKIQQWTRMVRCVEQLHFVPPSAIGTFQLPWHQLVLDHGCWHCSFSFGINMQSYACRNITAQHVVQTIHVRPIIPVAMYDTGTIYRSCDHGLRRQHLIYCGLTLC